MYIAIERPVTGRITLPPALPGNAIRGARFQDTFSARHWLGLSTTVALVL